MKYCTMILIHCREERTQAVRYIFYITFNKQYFATKRIGFRVKFAVSCLLFSFITKTANYPLEYEKETSSVVRNKKVDGGR
jgi:hypothetical protein